MNRSRVISTVFVQGAYLGYRLILAVLLSVVLIVVDVRYEQLDPVRRVLNTLLTPFQSMSDIPSQLVGGVGFLFTSRSDLEDELDSLKAKVLVLERKSQKLASTTAELNRLRELLNASRVLDDGVVVTELVSVSPDPSRHYITINRGAQTGVYEGQAVLDEYGLVGQVIDVSEFQSRVLLISDERHAVPVQVNRNGVRAVAYGLGSLSELELGNVPDTADIVVGDLLVSSGLGGRFPQGYPVAKVVDVEHDPSASFANVRVEPRANLNRSRLLLLVFPDGSGEGARPSDTDGHAAMPQGESK